MQPGIVDLHDVCVRMALHEHLIARLVAVPHTIGVVHTNVRILLLEDLDTGQRVLVACVISPPGVGNRRLLRILPVDRLRALTEHALVPEAAATGAEGQC